LYLAGHDVVPWLEVRPLMPQICQFRGSSRPHV
jgi:hypothetical protein